MKTIIATIGITLLFATTGYPQFCDPPGEVVGTTEYPVQSSGSSTNRIAFDEPGGVHITWMHGPSSFQRNVYYNFRHEVDGWWGETVVGQNNGAGYPTMALTSDYRAAIAYHNVMSDYVILAVDQIRGFGVYNYYDPPDMAPSGNHAFWPQVAISANGDIHILMVEHTQDPGVYPSMIYSRSEDGGETWTAPVEVARVALLNGCITASSNGKVAIVYLNPVIQGEFSQVKNDVCYFVSEDGRTWDFSRPENITDYWNDDLEIYCPWGIDAVFDNEGNLNFTWVTGHIDDDGYFIDETAQLWHYSEYTGVINQIAESSDEELTCTYGAVTLPISMPSISFDELYGFDAISIIYVGYDESDASSEGECVGDLYGVFGYENGEFWSGSYNLTETHSPGCAPDDCQSENFATISERMENEVNLTYVKQKLGGIPDTVYYMPVEILIPDGVEDKDQLPGSFELLGNYPNPFNARTTIEFELFEDTDVKLAVYDITGAKVTTLVNGEMEAGLHSVSWNADGFASGIYYYKLETDSGSQMKKMLFLK